MFEFVDFSKCEYSDRHGTYGGNAGDKDGIIYNNEYWIVKYPKSTKNMDKLDDISYVSSPLSEYIGSHIYEILGIETHETKLGFRNNTLVVGCKDFCEFIGQLREMRSLKNAAYSELSKKLEQELGHSSTGDRVNLSETLLHLQYNPIINKVSGVKELFWETVIIDVLIGNSDRNNGNWGVLYHPADKSYSMAPVYDNGNSFYNKMSELKIQSLYNEGKSKVKEISCGLRTAYDYDNHMLSAKKIFNKIHNPDLDKILLKLTPLIESKINQIKSMIDEIPNEIKGYTIISDDRKQFYFDSIQYRFEQVIKPAFLRVQESMLSDEFQKEVNDILPPKDTETPQFNNEYSLDSQKQEDENLQNKTEDIEYDNTTSVDFSTDDGPSGDSL